MRTPKNSEPFGAVVFLELFKLRILWGKATTRGDIDDEPNLTAPLSQGRGGAINHGNSRVIQCGEIHGSRSMRRGAENYSPIVELLTSSFVRKISNSIISPVVELSTA